MAEMQGLRRRCGAVAGRLVIAGGLAGLLVVEALAQQDTERGYATQPFTPKDFRLPQGTGCAGDVARWKAVQDNDYASGNIGLKVYHQIAAEIDRADAACKAGQDAAASAMVRDSKRRHGYPG